MTTYRKFIYLNYYRNEDKEDNKDSKRIKSKWTQQEDEKLLFLRDVKKLSTWKDIEKHFVSKNRSQCSYRYTILKKYNKFVWSEKEDKRLLELSEVYGERFDLMYKFFPRKSINDIKERFDKLKGNSAVSQKIISCDDVLLDIYYNRKVLSLEEMKLLKIKDIREIQERLVYLLSTKGEKLDIVNFTDKFSNFLINSEEILSNNREANPIGENQNQVKKEIENEDIGESVHSTLLTNSIKQHDYIDKYIGKNSNSNISNSPSHYSSGFQTELNTVEELSQMSDFMSSSYKTFSTPMFANNNQFHQVFDTCQSQSSNKKKMNSLLREKSKGLREVYNKIISLTENLNQEIYPKIRQYQSSNLCNPKLSEYNILCQQEDLIIQTIKKVDLSLKENKDESGILLQQVECLTNFIQIFKQKIKFIKSIAKSKS